MDRIEKHTTAQDNESLDELSREEAKLVDRMGEASETNGGAWKKVSGDADQSPPTSAFFTLFVLV